MQDVKHIKPPSTSTDKHTDLPGKVPSTPRHEAVIEANFAFQNFTENLGLSSKSAPKDKKQADGEREKKTQQDRIKSLKEMAKSLEINLEQLKHQLRGGVAAGVDSALLEQKITWEETLMHFKEQLQEAELRT